MKRRGGYAWGGPSTLELLRTKYFSPHIDEQSFLKLYDLPSLQKIQAEFALTDIWVTYTWGFSDAKEHKQHRFLQSKLKNFSQLGLKTHLYVQGLNLVTKDFPTFTGWCRDTENKLLPYSKDRAFICPNHPESLEHLKKNVLQAAKEQGHGVFVDNILFGFPPPLVRKDYLPFFGCNCSFCKQKYFEKYGEELIFDTKCTPSTVKNYLAFRSDSTKKLIQTLSKIVRAEKKAFGINLYDPMLHDDEFMYGYKLQDLLPYLDYLLIENHALNPAIGGNQYLAPLKKMTNKPIFVVSYDKGIGFDASFSKNQYAHLARELEEQAMIPCFKLTEFISSNTWHAVRFPLPSKEHHAHKKISPQPKDLLSIKWWEPPVFRVIGAVSRIIIRAYFSSQLINRLVNMLGLYSLALHQEHLYKK